MMAGVLYIIYFCYTVPTPILEKRSHRRHGSTASQLSSKSNDSSFTGDFGIDGNNMPESPSIEIGLGLGGLTLMDAESPGANFPGHDFPSSSDLGTTDCKNFCLIFLFIYFYNVFIFIF